MSSKSASDDPREFEVTTSQISTHTARAVRVPIVIALLESGPRAHQIATAVSLSRASITVETDAPLPQGSRVAVAFVLPNNREERIVAVVSVGKPTTWSSVLYCYPLAIQDITPEHNTRLAAFISDGGERAVGAGVNLRSPGAPS
jgi:hypothetical protein